MARTNILCRCRGPMRHRFDPRRCPPLTHCTDAVRVGDDGTSTLADPSDAELAAAGFDTNALASTQDRAIAVKAFNDSRAAMAQAQQGHTIEAISSGVGVAVVALSFAPPPWNVAGPLLAGFWAGSVAALKALTKIFGSAQAGLGQWTEWCASHPPIDENDPNWWHADTGYAAALQRFGRGADTPYTRDLLRLGWPHEPEMHGFGDIEARIARVVPNARAFARFAIPLLYRAYELAMNCRSWDAQGFANQPRDITDTFDSILHLWNSQHDGPSVGVEPSLFPFAGDEWFLLNAGALKSQARLVRPLGSVLGSLNPLPGVDPNAHRVIGLALGGSASAQAAIVGTVHAAQLGDVAAQDVAAELATAHDALAALAKWIVFYGGAKKAS